VLNRLFQLLLVVLVAPSVLAAGFGWWNPLAAWQQHVGLALLHHCSNLMLLSPWARDGLIGYYEVPFLLVVVAVVLWTARSWEPRLPFVSLWLIDLLEGLLALGALVAVGGLLAVACALDRPLFFAGLLAAAVAMKAHSAGRTHRTAPDPMRPERLPETGEMGRALALGLALLAGAAMLSSILLPWLDSQSGRSLDGSELGYGWVGAVLGAGALLALSRLPESRATISVAFGSLGALHAAVSAVALLPADATPGRGLLIHGGASLCLLAAGLIETSRPFDVGWRGAANKSRRVVSSLFALGVLIFASTSIWEGIAFSNPVFRLSRVWVDSLGVSPWLSGGVWLLLGTMGALLGLKLQRGRGLPLNRSISRAGFAVLVVALVLSVWTSLAQPGSHLVVAGSLSALGLLVLAFVWAPLVQSRLMLRSREGVSLDPRRWLSALLPLIAWGALCMVRGLSVWMWTQPVDLPEGVELLAGPEELGDPGCIFSLAVMPSSGDVWFTDRCKTALGRLASDGSLQTWDLKESGAHQVEELGGPVGGRLWVAISARTEEAQLALLAVDDEGPRKVGEPGASVPVASCWVSAWVPIPPENRGDPVSEVLLGCEEHSMRFIFSPVDGVLGPSIEFGAQVEDAVFHPDATHLYSVSLWRDSVVKQWSWPYLEPEGEHFVGPFNWGVVTTSKPTALWVSRFLEGGVLILDPLSGELLHRLSLSFGVRSLLSDPVTGLVWAAASYSGKLWALEQSPPYERRSFNLCGQTRDIVSDADGRVTVATDCGLYRIDPSAWGQRE